MKKALILIYTIFFIVCFNTLADNLVIDNISGGLENKIDESLFNTITELTIKGSINQKDISFIRDNLYNIEVLDLQNCNITNYSSYEADEFPEYGFYKEYDENHTKQLKKIVLPENLKKIGSNAFKECWSLKEVVLGNNITEIKKGAFSNCSSLSNFNFTSSLKKIESYAFFGCYSLKTLLLNDNITIIEPFTFFGCSSLSTIKFSNKITSILDYAFTGCVNLIDIKLPESLLHIGEYCFSGATNLKTINFPSSIKNIRQYAFEKCNSLDNIEFKNSEIFFEEGVFSNCFSLKNIILPTYIKTIPDYFLMGAESLENYEIPINVKKIGKGAFSGNTMLKNISFSEKITVIEEMAFSGCSNLLNANLPINVETIGSGAFSMCVRLESFTIPQKVKRIEDFTFSLCSNLKNITSNSIIEYIGEGAFSDCYLLESFNLSNKLKYISSSAFENCYALSSLNLPGSVSNIGNNAFNSINFTNKIISNIKEPFAIENKTFDDYAYNNVILNVPYGSADLYRNTSGWSNFKNIEELSAIIGNYSIDVLYNEGGYITYNGNFIESENNFDIDGDSEYLINVFPADGFKIENVMLNGKSISVSDNSFIIKDININSVLECHFKINEYNLLIIESEASSYSEFLVDHGSSPRIKISSSDNNEDLLTVKVNGEILTSKIISGDFYKMDPIKENTTILIEKSNNVSIERIPQSKVVKHWTHGNQLFIESDKKINNIEIFDFEGRQIHKSIIDNYSSVLKLDINNSYIVNVFFSDSSSEQIKVFLN